jgi:hypothetical protein
VVCFVEKGIGSEIWEGRRTEVAEARRSESERTGKEKGPDFHAAKGNPNARKQDPGATGHQPVSAGDGETKEQGLQGHRTPSSKWRPFPGIQQGLGHLLWYNLISQGVLVSHLLHKTAHSIS